MVKKYELPKLPYSYSALEPVISTEIMELHYLKHHNGYVTNLNIALEKYAEAEKNEDLNSMIALQSAIRFNGGGHINHTLFWENLAPVKEAKKAPSGELATAIKEDFGSLDNFIKKFNSTVAPLQGSGWGWLGYVPDSQQLIIVTTQNQDSLFATQKILPLLGIDVWEHAYYLQYKNVRPDYLNAIWQVINWSIVEKRYEVACNLVSAN